MRGKSTPDVTCSRRNYSRSRKPLVFREIYLYNIDDIMGAYFIRAIGACGIGAASSVRKNVSHKNNSVRKCKWRKSVAFNTEKRRNPI